VSLFTIVDGEVCTDRACSKCPLGQRPGLLSNCMQGVGATEPLLMFVGVSPNDEDDAKGAPFTGAYGRMLSDLFYEAGIVKSDYYITNAVKCASADPQRKHWEKCLEHMVREIERVRPHAIVTVGAAAARWLTGFAPNRRRSYPCVLDPSIRVYTAKQPAELYHVEGRLREELRAQMIEDLSWIKRDALGENKTEVIEFDYRVAKTLDDVDSFLAELETAPEVAYDFETNFLGRPYKELGHKIVAVGFSARPGHALAIPIHAKAIVSPTYWPDGIADVVERRVANFLSRKKVFGHNGILYDSIASEVLLGVKPIIDFDVMHCAHLIDENPPHNLEDLTLRYVPSMDGWKQKFNTEDPKKLCEYLWQDVDATSRLRRILEPMLSPKQRKLFDTLIIPLAWRLQKMMVRGVKVNTSVLDELAGPLRQEMAALAVKLRSHDQVTAWELTNNQFFNPGSPVQVAQVMEHYFKIPRKKDTKSGGYSTDDEVLEANISIPFCSQLLEYRGLDKLCGTYVDGYKTAAATPPSLVHTNFKMLTVTGRLSSSAPNLQNLPVIDDDDLKSGALTIKHSFTAREDGWCLLQADYSQAEYRVLASIARDENLIESFRKGYDVHAATAARLFGVPVDQVTKVQRVEAKRVNFGLVYGQGEKGQIAKAVAAAEATARKQKRKLSRKEYLAIEESVRRNIQGHRDAFPNVWKWMAQQERIIETRGVQETPTGRRRHYAKVDNRAKRQGLNFPVQGLSADITNTALIRCSDVLEGSGIAAFPVLTVHDSIIFEVREDLVFDVADIVQTVMQGVKFPWLLVDMVADLEAGYSWGQMHDIDVKNRCFKEK
jgi:DNA polymerase-1